MSECSLSVTIRLFFFEPLSAWMGEAVNSDGEVIATTHSWEHKNDVLSELFVQLAEAKAVTA